MCATRWESTVGVEHSRDYGATPEASVTVGGELGDACEADKSAR